MCRTSTAPEAPCGDGGWLGFWCWRSVCGDDGTTGTDFRRHNSAMETTVMRNIAPSAPPNAGTRTRSRSTPDGEEFDIGGDDDGGACLARVRTSDGGFGHK